jgi:histone acetyltransferase HTATIP
MLRMRRTGNENSDDNRLHVSVADISEDTCIKKDDVISTLNHLNLMLYYKGQYIIVVTNDQIDAHRRAIVKRTIRIDPRRIVWQPKDWSRKRLPAM